VWGFENNCPAIQSALSRPFYLLTSDSFTALATSEYGLSKQAIHHEIEWFFITTFKSIETYPYRGISRRGEYVNHWEMDGDADGRRVAADGEALRRREREYG